MRPRTSRPRRSSASSAATIEGEPTRTSRARWHVERVDEQALAEGRIWPQSRGSQLAGLAVGAREGERVLDLCAAPGRQGDDARGRGRRRRGARGARARARGERPPARAPTNVRSWSSGRARPAARARRLRPRARRRALLGPRRPRRAPDLRWRAEPLPELQLELLRAAAERVRPGGTVVYAVCTVNADENEAVVDASGLEVEPLGDEWPQFRHPRRPEFLLTLPHVHRTSGFFVARLRVP